MAGYNKLLKRKGLDHVTDDDFSDFPLSSPATKIRRLDAELPPIAQVELEHDQPFPAIPTPPIAAAQELEAAAAAPPVNEERALVLFKPLLHSSSPFSLTLNPGLISQIKNEVPWPKQRDSDCDRLLRSAAEREEEEKRNRGMALVPWVPSTSASSQFPILQDSNNTELMEADELGGEGEGEGEASMMMDVEQQDTTIDPPTSTIHPTASTLHLSHDGGIAGIAAAAATTTPEGFHQWHQQQHQQHCFLPQIPQTTSTPITWTR